MEVDSGEGRRSGLGRETERIQPLHFCGRELTLDAFGFSLRTLWWLYTCGLYTELEPLPLLVLGGGGGFWATGKQASYAPGVQWILFTISPSGGILSPGTLSIRR